MSASVAGKPYIQMWPLPGGAGKYLANLEKVLDWINAHPRATPDQILEWFQGAYKLKSTLLAKDYLRSTLCPMGYLNMSKETITLTPAGRHYVETKDREFVVGGYLSECVGAWEVLEAVRQSGLSHPDVVHKALQSSFPQWKTNNPYLWRLDWLLSFGCLVKVRSEYGITQYGEQALQRYRGPGPAASVSSRVSQRPAVPEVPQITVPAVRPDLVGEKPARINHKSISETRLDELIAEIERTSLASDEATDFERALRKAFAFLGLWATHKSGAGDTDILIEAPLGNVTYRAVVDGKSSKHGKITTAAVNWSALNKHRQMYDADHTLVVAPGFSSGDLHNYAKDAQAALITAYDLCEILRLHYATPFSLVDLRHLFSHPGEPARPLQDMDERHKTILRSQQLLSATIDVFVGGGSYEGEPISAEGLYYILRMSHKGQSYKKSEIQEALTFLASSFVNALRKVEDDTYVLEMTKETILQRLQAQIRAQL